MCTLKADEQVLDELEAGGERFPHLAPVFALQRALREAQLAVKAELPAARCAADQSRLLGGEPLLAFDDLAVDAAALAALAQRIMMIVLESQHRLQHHASELSAVEWLAGARRWFDSRLPPAGSIVSEEAIPQVVAAYALIPWLEHAAERCVSEVDLAAWRRPYCPMCGSYPDLALLTPEVGQRLLVCSRCSSQWAYRRTECVFCETPESGRSQYFLGFEAGDRLYVCDHCRTYLKTIDLRERSRPLSVYYERVRTVPLDFAARNKGYRDGSAVVPGWSGEGEVRGDCTRCG